MSPNASNSSEIIQGSLVRPISVHFRGSITYTRGLRRAPKPNFGLNLDFSIIFLIFFRPGLFLVTQTDIDTTLAYPFHQKHICAYLRYWDENWILWGAKRTRKWISFSKLIQSLYKSLISTIEQIIIIIIMNNIIWVS